MATGKEIKEALEDLSGSGAFNKEELKNSREVFKICLP